jgi:putative NADH-flavin reductase
MSKPLKIALFGATGTIGSRIAAEAARRGHQVTALARNPARVPTDVANLKAAQADLLDARGTDHGDPCAGRRRTRSGP